MGVLIHINPDDLIKNLSRIYDYSKKYILLGGTSIVRQFLSNIRARKIDYLSEILENCL